MLEGLDEFTRRIVPSFGLKIPFWRRFESGRRTSRALMWFQCSRYPIVAANIHGTSWPNGAVPAGVGQVRATTFERSTVAHPT